MLKQTITYKDWDDVTQTETLHFNLSKDELIQNLHLKDQLETLGDKLEGEPRELTISEVQEILGLVRTFMRLAYGVRDGQRFDKRPERWEEFSQTAAYNAFMESLFTDPNQAINFMFGVLPQDLRTAVEEAQKEGKVVELPTAPPVLEETAPVAPEQEKKAEPTDEELLKMRPQDMSREQLQRAFALKNK